MYLAYLFPQYGGMELAPFERQFDTSVGKQVVKASSGHIPQPFLISDLKSCGKDREERWILADKFFSRKARRGAESAMLKQQHKLEKYQDLLVKNLVFSPRFLLISCNDRK
jgi:hypothetical protein